ncbi:MULTISPECIES: DUF4244 domain-containing protein [unclassified Arthrobacter]|uniref:DUF4244 domain-containing protein n=1 Tax=unclassified Arthrobacter TaxID=235627 RepID=UPI0003737C18|nr:MULTISPECIES: DUF4244 domain-containing protein [unclassified Arthrobacter]TDT86194.1 uncharacterized protein DUF4244 [Arthrobacter sp. AG258]
MSIHHHRCSAGTPALADSATAGTSPGGQGFATGGTGHASAPIASARHGAAAADGNVVELYPGSDPFRHGNRRRAGLLGSEAGMATAEYAIATLAAVGFAGLLVFILRSDEVRGFLLNLIRTALALP